jgi:hypothetical protein
LTEAKQTQAAQGKSISWLVMTLIFTGAGLSCLVGFAFYSFGSIGSALAYTAGNALIADRSSKTFGNVQQGERPVITFNVTNNSERQITILGAKTQCTCVFAEELPLSVPARSRRSLNIAVETDSRDGEVREPILLFTDYPDQNELRLVVGGRVVRAGGQPGQKNRGEVIY